jgi:nucleolar protein 56
MARFSAEREALLAETKTRIAASVNDDSLIIQAVTTMEQLDHATNSLAKKAREWYGLRDPELEHQVKDHERFLELAATEEQKRSKSTMGANLAPEDEEEIAAYLVAVRLLYEERQRILAYLESKMRTHCPNVASLAGATIGAKLLSHAGSLERLASVPSSTLQLFGAETALFRHLRDRRKHRSPKYGVLFNHPLVQKVVQPQRGKAARSLADKLSLCAKLDYFKGEFKAEEYRRQLAAKFTEW